MCWSSALNNFRLPHQDDVSYPGSVKFCKNFLSQRENFKLVLLPNLVLMTKFELVFLGGWRTEKLMNNAYVFSIL